MKHPTTPIREKRELSPFVWSLIITAPIVVIVGLFSMYLAPCDHIYVRSNMITDYQCLKKNEIGYWLRENIGTWPPPPVEPLPVKRKKGK